MDYKKLNFKCGLEIHQQLETKKLFCDCPSILTDKIDLIIKRRLKAVAGESGKIDIAAIHETQKNKEFIYKINYENTCSVEYDEEPPHNLNKDALGIALQIVLLLNAKIPDELQIMRKTVVDGSNTSGFQRTVLVGRNGYINTSKGKVRISIICLEEDSARKIKEEDKSITFNLDRLGIPLIEIGTEPDIKDPEHAKETAKILGMILRSTGKVKRGIGTIRQDVNVSIENGSRVEIKGFQDLRKMPLIIEKEIKRQLKTKIKPEVRKANPNGTTSFLRPIPGEARMYPETDIRTITITKEILKKIEIPELISKRTQRFEKLGIPENTARGLVKQGINLDNYNYNLDKKLIANLLIEIPKDIKKRNRLDYSFKKQDFDLVLSLYEKKQISKSAINEILTEIAKGNKPDINKYKLLDETILDKEIKKIIENNRKLIKEKKERSIKILMGELIKKFRGKTDNSLLFKKLKKEIYKTLN